MRIFYDDTIRIQRLKGSGNIRKYVATATAEASIQPLGKDRAAIDTGVFGKSFIAYCDAEIPAAVDDRVVDRNGNAYTITDVVIREFGAFPYKEMILKRT